MPRARIAAGKPPSESEQIPDIGFFQAFATGSLISPQAKFADQLTIDIEDDGPGIPDAQKQNVLEPFVRGDDARNMDEAAGFGLVLSIARTIAIAHHGVLSLNDRQPHGLIVRIQLPVRQQTQPSAV